MTEKVFDAKKMALELIAEYNITKEDFKECAWNEDDGNNIYEAITSFFEVREKVEEVIEAMGKVLTNGNGKRENRKIKERARKV